MRGIDHYDDNNDWLGSKLVKINISRQVLQQQQPIASKELVIKIELQQ